MTPQEIFDKTIHHLISMNGPCVRQEDGMCLYRGEGGAKCAAGFWIPDNLYHPSLEGSVVSSVHAHLLGEAAPHLKLISDLQHEVHDVVTSWNRTMTQDGTYHYTWNIAGLQKNINRMAEKHGLKTVEI